MKISQDRLDAALVEFRAKFWDRRYPPHVVFDQRFVELDGSFDAKELRFLAELLEKQDQPYRSHNEQRGTDA